METRSVPDTSVDLSHLMCLLAREDSIEFYCCGNAKTCFFSCLPSCIVTLYCLSVSFIYFLSHPPVALLFLYCFLSSLCCFFFYLSVPFFHFVCLSLLHFSSFHYLLFICPLCASIYWRRGDGIMYRMQTVTVWLLGCDSSGFEHKYQCLGRICHFHLEGIQISLLLHPENAGWMFLRKVSNDIPRTTASRPRRRSLH